MFEKLCALKNKKGFTLIEMLVVIAIIAVLVAIAIPVVSSSTDKAAAATNAANLRSLQAEATTLYLSGAGDTLDSTNLTIAISGSDVTVTIKESAPKAKKIGGLAGGEAATATFDSTNKEFVFKYGNAGIDEFTAVAEGTADADTITAGE